MSKPPAFQFYPSDFLADENVVLMTNQEVGCYIKLLCYCWRQKTIPKEIKQIAKLCGETPEKMIELWPQIEPCFNLNGNRYFNKRLDIERKKQLEWRRKSQKGGRVSAKRRAVILKGGSSGRLTNGSSLQSAVCSLQSAVFYKKQLVPTIEEIKEAALTKIEDDIKVICNYLYEENIFGTVYKFKNKMIKEQKNLRSILYALCRCIEKKPEKPWAYCQKIMEIEDGNFAEKDQTRTL